MRFKKFRFWLAEKLIGGKIEEMDMEARRQEWIKDQLAKGGKVILEYEVNTVH